MRNMKIAELLFNRPLMISETKLNSILHVLGPRFNLDMTALPTIAAESMPSAQTQTSGYEVKNGIATISVHGPLVNRLNVNDFPSGGPTTYTNIRRAFETAIADTGVKAVIMDIDSPGGEVNGAFDLADYIFTLRGPKPITAIINESAYSAAYLLASSADRIIIPRTGGCGSIGVIASHADISKYESEEGIKITHVYAGARKADYSPHFPLSEEAFNRMQEQVNDTYSLFVETVARNRNLSPEAVKGTDAGFYIGKKAVAAGLADEVAPAHKAAAAQTKTKKENIKMSTETTVPTQSAGPNCGGCSCQGCEQQGSDCGTCKDKPGMNSIAAAQQAGAATERTNLLALHSAIFGETAGTKFSAIVATGVTASQAKALGVSAETDSTDDSASRAAILNAITSAAATGLKPTQAAAPATATINTAAIYAARKNKKPL